MGDRPRSRLLLTNHELASTEKVRLQLAHQGESRGHASTMGDLRGQGELDEEVMELAD